MGKKKRQGEKLITTCSQAETPLLDGLVISTAIGHFTYHVVRDKR